MPTIKVLVPTDFSGNSKTAFRFAIQWSIQQKIELQFLHVFHINRIPQWTDYDYKKYISSEKIFYENKLKQFASGIYQSSGIKAKKHACIALHGASADISIMDYCLQEGDISFICIGTRGAGKIKKIFGTHSGNLITKSQVPVIAVPKSYGRRKPIKSLLYATDFSLPENELKKVFEFARPLKASVTMLHLAWPGSVPPDREAIEKKLMGKHGIDFKLKIVTDDLFDSLTEGLKAQVEMLKPSMTIMFTDQSRTLFQKIFSPSRAEQLSFETKVPLLVYKKE